jgi:predicted GNAT superfamily acetyltransferase
LLVRIPLDYLQLREQDPAAAGRARDEVADALEGSFRHGYRAVGFVRRGAYVLERS